VQIFVWYNDEPLWYDREGNYFRCLPTDVEVAIPGGVVGVHALYCIFENIIRNGAKYGANRNPTLQLWVRIYAPGPNDDGQYYRVELCDDHSIVPPDTDMTKEATMIRARYSSMMKLFPPEIDSLCDQRKRGPPPTTGRS